MVQKTAEATREPNRATEDGKKRCVWVAATASVHTAARHHSKDPSLSYIGRTPLQRKPPVFYFRLSVVGRDGWGGDHLINFEELLVGTAVPVILPRLEEGTVLHRTVNPLRQSS